MARTPVDRLKDLVPARVNEEGRIFLWDENGKKGPEIDLVKYDRPLSQVNINIVSISDRGSEERREYISHLFPSRPVRDVSSFDIQALSQAVESYDMLVVSLDDIGRFRKVFAKPAKTLIMNKISIAVGTRFSPADRAVLLNFGFDDVFQLTMPLEEAMVRLMGILARHQINQSIRSRSEEVNLDEFSEQHVIGILSYSQKRIVKELLKHEGSPVKFSQLATFDYVTREYNLNALRVAISGLRRRLFNCRIRTVKGIGYALDVYR
ncbi:hypothetical protein U4960_04305 [Altererythrobacter sp. H2]|uniref:hypothetical protein n=1 Tax=Altererythrobacter sp. H2 TaxID=3108391 RepID=UPI002B4C18B1|nr:hypothetical protein [Altererythrobacter sp. H2]WRK96553.1 hypothetical protein U4960_04305 [Altererythrobacter sp. H2]